MWELLEAIFELVKKTHSVPSVTAVNEMFFYSKHCVIQRNFNVAANSHFYSALLSHSALYVKG